MNINPYNLNYQDGLNTYPIIDYINDQIGLGGGGTGGGINSYVYLYQNSNLMIANNTSNASIYFRVYNSPNATNGNYPYSVKIDKDGKLYVYHIYDVFNPTMGAGWYDLEKEMANAIFNTIQTNIQFLAIEGELVILAGNIATNQTNFNNFKNLTNASLLKISDSLETIGNSFQALTTEETTDAIFRASGSISAYVNNSRALFSVQRSFYNQLRVGLGNVANVVTNPFLVAGVGLTAGLIGMILGTNSYNYNDRFDTNSNGDFTLDATTRAEVRTSNYSNILQFTSNFITDMSNINVTFGFINSNVTSTQYLPTLKSNKVLLGNITTPNASYQMEMTGDLNTNMLHINSTSLTSLLNQKQDNMSATQPIYITTSTIGLNYDSSLTKIGNNLSVVKTASAPLRWSGNDIILDYDNTLLNNAGSLGVSISAESKWGYSGGNIYNKSLTNVGIGTNSGLTSKLVVAGETYISSNTHIGIAKLNAISSYTGATLTLATGTNEYYLQYTANGTLVLNEPCACDLFLVGGGGYGGAGASSGGGGAGEVIYYPNFPLRNGTLTINVGTASTTVANRISSITHSSGTLISAKGGGDGGIPDYLFTSGGTITVNINATALYNYTDSVTIAPATYTISFANGNITLTGLSANRSFPLLKDGSLNTIAPHIWYKFEDTYNFLVDSGAYGTYTLTNNGSTFDTTNYVRGYGSIVVDTGKNVSIASTINFYSIQTTTGITFSLWVKLTGGTTFGRIFHFSGTDQSADGMCCISRNAGTNGIQLNLWTTSSNRAIVYDSSYNYFNNTWYFLTWTISSSGVWSYYVNGASVSITSTTFSFVSTKSYNVNKVIGGNYLSEYITGNVDDFRIYAKDLTATEVLELYKGRVIIYSSPKSGGSGGGGAKSQTGASAGVKYDDYKSFALSGLSGNSTTGGNGGCGNTTYSRYTTTITGSSLSVGLGGTGVGPTPAGPTTKTNYGDGGDGNGGVGFQGLVIIRFKIDSNYLQVKATKDNANAGLILNANESPNAYQLRVFPWSDTFTSTGVATRGWSFRVHDGNANMDLLNLFSSFSGRVGIKTKNPLATFDVNGDINCKTFFVNGNEQYGILCQIANAHALGESSIVLIGGSSGSYGSCSITYNPSISQGVINCTRDLVIKTNRYDSYIYINDTTGYVGIGLTNPQSKLELVGDIHSTSMTATTGNFNSVSTYALALNNGNITGCNRVNSVDVWTGPVKCTTLDLAGGNITNGGFFYGMAQQARFLNMSTNEWHYDTQSRNRFYFTNDGTNSHTVFRTGSTTHYFQDKDGVDYCLLDRFGISTYLEVVSASGYDNMAVADTSSTGVYVYRRFVVKLNTFTEVHRCFCEDPLFTNYDDFINEYIGRVVISNGKIKTATKKEGEEWKVSIGKDGITIDDSHPMIELSRQKKDKRVLGVITKRNQNNDLEGRLVINSLGETAIWIVNTNGNLENGDLITTSNELGYGEKQVLETSEADDLIHNYTIGKIMIDCSFDLSSNDYKCEDLGNGLRRAFVPIFIYSG